MQIEKLLSVVCYSVFLIYSWLFGEFLTEVGASDFYKLAFVVGLFFINIFFTMWMNHLDEKMYNSIRIPFIILWTAVTITVCRIAFIPFSQVLMLLVLDFVFYFIVITYMYKIVEHRSIKDIVLEFYQKRFMRIIIIMSLLIIFILIRTIIILSHYNKTVTGYFVEYIEEASHVYDTEYYPTFSYVINGEVHIYSADYPILVKKYQPEKENEVKLLYNEEYPNQIVIKSDIVLNIISIFVMSAGIIAIIYVYNKNKLTNSNEG